ncbi:MAG: tRNA (adenosine(37)-N6)-threonylcarbamoyltransferase complex dimerization subunit type 1 TsaB [Candidatus Omnitrophota bacterium]
MKILGIDTTTKFLCIGAYDNGKIYEYNLELFRLQSAFLIPTLEMILKALNWDIGKIDYFACGLGPGSFTGIRIGLSTIKAFAWSQNKQIIGIPSLDILANNYIEADKIIVPAIDAKRGQVFCSAYKNHAGVLKRIMPDMLLSKNDFFKKIKPSSVVLGDALELYKEEISKNISAVTLLDKDYWYPQAHNIIKLALENIKAKKFNSAFSIKPIYLYPDACQIVDAVRK